MWLTDLQIVLPDRVIERGGLLLRGTQIAAIVEGAVPTDSDTYRVSCAGLTAIPGIIDMHGDMLEIEAEPRPGAHFPLDMALFELDKRLAANGVTTAYAAISFWDMGTTVKQRSVVRSQDLVATIHQMRDQLLIDLRVHARYEVTTPVVAPILLDLLEQNLIHLLSLTDHTPGQGQYQNLEKYVYFISKWRDADPTDIRAQAEERIRQGRDELAWGTAAEVVAVAESQGVIIASHDDDTVAKIDLMADMMVTMSEFPVSLEAAREAKRRGMAVVMGAPNVLRGGSHSGNLSATDAIREGLVDLLAADYSPASLLQSAFRLASEQIVPLHEAVRLLGQGPADALSLHDRGRIEVGLSADLVLVEATGRPRVRGTIRQGTPIYWDGDMARRSFKL